MEIAKRLLLENRAWVSEMLLRDQHFFQRLANGQSPDVLWIGCSDSRVPAERITNAEPGDLFVHRNIANIAIESDASLMSVLQYAVEVLKVKSIIVCGHQGCGGVRASLARVPQLPHVDARLESVRQVYRMHCTEVDKLDDDGRVSRLVELNAIAQVRNLAANPIVRKAWAKGMALDLHAWVYSLHDGLLEEKLVIDATSDEARATLAA